ncbi:unnamed protein product [Linum tenue]|uniref:Ubiquitin-like domain-containing protein n=2 Tax=Linum tenue TaxID=586396 RepID=A0AAV0LTX5_9ROSI|nr:unnamed protein product [Linum tenue]
MTKKTKSLTTWHAPQSVFCSQHSSLQHCFKIRTSDRINMELPVDEDITRDFIILIGNYLAFMISVLRGTSFLNGNFLSRRLSAAGLGAPFPFWCSRFIRPGLFFLLLSSLEGRTLPSTASSTLESGASSTDSTSFSLDSGACSVDCTASAAAAVGKGFLRLRSERGTLHSSPRRHSHFPLRAPNSSLTSRINTAPAMESNSSRRTSRESRVMDKEPQNIIVKVLGMDGSSILFRINQATPLRRLMLSYCDWKELVVDDVYFLHNGRRLLRDDTAQKLNMTDGDVIHEFVHQTGS